MSLLPETSTPGSGRRCKDVTYALSILYIISRTSKLDKIFQYGIIYFPQYMPQYFLLNFGYHHLYSIWLIHQLLVQTANTNNSHKHRVHVIDIHHFLFCSSHFFNQCFNGPQQTTIDHKEW